MKRFLLLGMISFVAALSVGFIIMNKTRIVLIGDSTVRSGHEERPDGVLWGWGTALKEQYANGQVDFDNQAIAGHSSRTFYASGAFDQVLAGLSAGDVLLMQFGHNDGGSVTGDGKASLRGTGDNIQNVTNPDGKQEVVHSYGWYLRYFVQQAKAKGVKPVVLSPVPRNSFVEGFTVRSLEDYGLWARQIAESETVDFLDLNNRVADLYDFMGSDAVAAFFPQDNLHTNREGAAATAEIVYQGLKDLGIVRDSETNENVWELLGTASELSATVSTHPEITTVKSGETTVPYAVFRNADGLVVKRMLGSNSWEQVGDVVATTATTYSRIWADKLGKIYVTYADGTGSGAQTNHYLAIKYYDPSSNSWIAMGSEAGSPRIGVRSVINPVSQLVESRNHAMAFDRNNIPYIVYVEARGDNVPMVKRYVNGAWELVGSGAASTSIASSVSIAFDSANVPYITYLGMAAWNSTTGTVAVRYFKDNAWQSLEVTNGGSARHPQMSIANDILYIAFMHAADGSRATVVYRPVSAGDWASFGRLSDAATSDFNVDVDDTGNLFLAYMEGALARVFHLPKGSSAFVELTQNATATGVDQNASRLGLVAGGDRNPYIIYLKPNLAEISTPVVQRYILPKVTYPPNTWELLGAESQLSAIASTYPGVTTTVTGETYTIFATSDGLSVKRMVAAGSWEQVGAFVTTTANSYSRIWSDKQGKIYVTYADGTGSGAQTNHYLAIKYYDASSNSWLPMGTAAGNPRVGTRSLINPVSQLAQSRNHALAFDKDDIPYVVYVEARGDNVPMVQRYVNGMWEVVGAGPASNDIASSVSIAFDSENVPYIGFMSMAAWNSTTGNAAIRYFKNNAWQSMEVSNGSGARHPQMTIANDHVYIGFMNAGDGSRATVIHSPISTIQWASFGRLSNAATTDFNIDRDGSAGVLLGFMEGAQARAFYLQKDGTSFRELARNETTTGLDDGTSRLTIAAGADHKPYAAYLKNNAAGIALPTIQRYHLVITEEEPEPEPEPGPDEVVTTPRWVETLDRGVVAVRPSNNRVFISWRLLGSEPVNLGFNVYRNDIKLNEEPIVGSTNYQDVTEENGKYTVVPVQNGEEQEPSKAVDVWTQGFLSIPMDIPPTGVAQDGTAYIHTANDLSVGDLDGDGEYEVVVKWEPTLSGDNLAGQRGIVYIDAYKLDGTKLWRLNLGKNIRAGAHYTQFLVYDFDGDGKAEVALRTSDGTVDGQGTVIGDANADWREPNGFILSGPEYLTVFEGLTGKALATVDYIPERGRVADWGDGYGNRVDRFVAAVAYLDGERPSMVFGRGYYTRMVRAAWDWRDGKLTSRWVFDSNKRGNEAYAGQGNHQMSVADLDNDGKDEIINGASAVNDNGRGLYVTGRGHGDALHVSKMDPNRDKQLVWMPHESPTSYKDLAVTLVDGTTGETLFGIPATRDIGRAMAADIDPRYPGYEMWSAVGGLYNVSGQQITPARPGSMNFGIWWDGDLLRELLDGTNIDKWDWNTNAVKRLASFGNQGAVSNNSTKATPGLSADILGDWREEVIYRSEDSKRLMVFSTAIPTTHRLYTLMHDPQYRSAIAWQNTAYNQPPHPSFYLGEGMAAQTAPNVAVVALERKPQEIVFPDMEDRTFDVGEMVPAAVATSGLRITYISDNPAVVEVDNQRLKFVGVGTANITAQQAGNIAWEEAAPIVKTLTVTKGIQTISFDPLPTLTVGDKPYEVVARSASGLPITLRSENPAIATVLGEAVEALQEGKVGVVASQEGNQLWEAATDVRQELLVLALPAMDIVKVLTPNGDGEHDVLVIREIERYPENNVQIFNRQGQLLFRMDNYNNADRVFEGRNSSGQLLNDGTYFLKLEWMQEGKKMHQNGWFYLKR